MVSNEVRPRTVTVASTALAAFVAVAVTDAVVSAVSLGRFPAAGDTFLGSGLAAQVADPADVVAVVRESLWFDLGVAVLAVVAFAVLAVAVRRPWQAARVLVWVAAAPLAVVLVCGIAVGLEYAPPSDIGMPVYTLADLGLLPGWHSTARSVLTTLEVVLLAVACFQLTREDSTDFYRSQILGPSLGHLAAEQQRRRESEPTG
ncbi:hypothetical protein ACFQZ4_35310 [Catellatospora coxensis]|uniref:Uncharacterized protein n=1 Tax=Catellatospora coxensis TaxID=310354 RepID=A0A8J3LAC6_9ACTN|nr:hypothetical protein [Catellatospora coxensis]GIG09135.1 hypothetical protein Cco03nite_58350 [Catellatospora coxensis]